VNAPTTPSTPPVTHRTILAIALPMTLGYLSTPLVGVADMTVVGQFGIAAQMGGVAVAAVLFDILLGTLNFLRSGTTGLVAQAFGRRDTAETQAVVLRALILAAGIGLALVALQAPLFRLGITLMGASPAVGAAAEIYFDIRILAAPASLMNYAIFGWLLGLGRAGTGLALQTLLNGVNIGLSILLGLTAGWGIAGVAWGTVIAEVLTLVVGLVILARAMRPTGWPRQADLFERTAFRQLLAVNRDIMIRSFVLITAFFFFTAQSAKLGDETLAANAVLEKFFLTASYFLDGVAAAAETLVGRAVGARHRPTFDRTLWLTTLWGYALAVIATLLVFAGGPALIALMTTSEPVRALAGTYLIYAALTPLIGFSAFQYDGIYIGATWSREMRNMMVASLAVFFAVWALTQPLGNHGLWIALLSFLGVRGLTLGLMLPAAARRTFSPPPSAQPPGR
jgi:MATE family multidrug resistance protein